MKKSLYRDKLFYYLLTVMKHTLITQIVLFLLCSFSVANTSGQEVLDKRVSLQISGASLNEALDQISSVSGVNFIYTGSRDETLKISASFRNETLGRIFNRILKANGFNYEIRDEYVVIRRSTTQPTVPAKPIQQPVKGIVLDDNKTPIPGVNIRVKSTGRVTSSGANGEFSIIANAGDVLVVSLIGQETKEVQVTDVQQMLRIELLESTASLSEVVVTGYQSINRKLFTGAAASISGEDVKQEGVADVSRMLEGRIAGLSIQNVSGTFGTAPKVRVRGVTSISGDNRPLWVVDGVVLEDIVNVSNDQLSSGNALTLLGSSVAGINADDIESFQVLKDASATALYGARAMNGVVVITTKKGKVGRTSVSYNGNFSSYFKPTYDEMNIMNSRDQMAVYQSLQDKAFLQYGSSANRSTGGVFTKMAQLIAKGELNEDGTWVVENTEEGRNAFLHRYARANTDWFDLLFKQSFMQEHAVSISSGNEKSRQYFSGNFLKDNGRTIADNMSRYTVNLRQTYTLSDKVSLDVLGNGSIREQRTPGARDRTLNLVGGVYNRNFDINPFSYAMNTSRTLTAYDENGDLEYFTNNYAPFNILSELNNNYNETNVLDFKAQTELKYKVIKGLEYNVIGMMRHVRSTREHKVTEHANMANAYRAAGTSIILSGNNFAYNDPDFPNEEKAIVLPQGGFYFRNDDNMKNYYARHTLTFDQTLGSSDNHNINIMAGQEIKYTDRQNSYNNGYGYQYGKGGVPFIDHRIIKQTVASGQPYYGMSMGFDRYVAFFGFARYAYQQKYVLNGTLRYDGSNLMGAAKTARWLPTWTMSGAWNIDEENFMEDVSGIEYLKLRGSYGLTGSIGSARNASVILTNTNTPRRYLEDIESSTVLTSLENSELTWEKQHEGNIGIDIGLNQGKLNFTIDFYSRNAFDLISTFETSGIGGQINKTANYADLKSSGVDFTVGNRFLKTTDWQWSSNITFSYNKNKIVNMQYEPRVIDLLRPEGGAKEDAPVRGLYSLVFTGLDPQNGLPIVTGLTGEPTMSVNYQSLNTEELKYEGMVDPIMVGGWTNTVNYKGVSMSFLISYQLGNKIRLDPAFRSSYTDFSAMPREFLNRWQMPGDELYTNIPNMIDTRTDVTGNPYNNYNYSDIRTVDGSFARLKNISLQYALPSNLSRRYGFSNISLAVNATNVWLIFADERLQGQDPEFFNSGGVASPLPRQITGTLRLGL